MFIRVYDGFRKRLGESGHMCTKTYEVSCKGMIRGSFENIVVYGS